MKETHRGFYLRFERLVGIPALTDTDAPPFTTSPKPRCFVVGSLSRSLFFLSSSFKLTLIISLSLSI